MYRIFNNFYKSDTFDKLPKILARKLFKIFKIFFVETNLTSLPDNNHPTIIDRDYQEEAIKKKIDKFYKPFSTCSYLLEVLSVYGANKKDISILDFGANNLDNFIYLKRYVKNLEYYYHDTPSYNLFMEELIKKNDLKDFKILKSIDTIPKLDFVFFGSSIHYVNNYKEIIQNIARQKSKYIIFSHTPFYKSNKNDKDIVLKQLNIHPIINYAYLLQYDNFIQFMKKNNYKLISQNKNNLIKFLNFKNFNNFSFLSFLDLIFINNDN